MTIESFLYVYYNQVRDVRESTLDQYRWVLVSFSKHVGRPAEFTDLRHEVVNAWIADLVKKGSRETAKSRRNTLLSIWAAAAALGYVERRQGVIKPVKTPARIVRALTPSHCRDVIDTARSLEGRLFGCPKGAYMATFLRATLETSLRQSCLHTLQWQDVLECRGRFQHIQVKTGVRRWVVMSDDLLEEIAAWHAPTGLIWPRGYKRTIGKIIREIGQKLNLRLTHTRLRQTAITDVERQQAGTGWLFAGHSTPTTTRRWYTDTDRAAEGIPKPTFFG